MTTKQQGSIWNLKMDHPLWYPPEFISNILSLALLKDQFRVTYDSENRVMFDTYTK